MRRNANEKRTVLITGVSSGIGERVAEKFIGNGWNIIGHYRTNSKQLAQIRKMADENHADNLFIQADLSTTSGISKFNERIGNERIDCLVNNAGSYNIKKEYAALTFADLTKTFGLNTFAPILIAAKVFEGMMKRKFGRIVNISSISAKYGGARNSLHYGCSKLALEGLTKTLAREGAGYNILVNTIRPGVIDTPFHEKYSKNMDERIKMIPLKRMGLPQEVADMVYYLGSDQNQYMTNETVTIAGGE